MEMWKVSSFCFDFPHEWKIVKCPQLKVNAITTKNFVQFEIFNKKTNRLTKLKQKKKGLIITIWKLFKASIEDYRGIAAKIKFILSNDQSKKKSLME